MIYSNILLLIILLGTCLASEEDTEQYTDTNFATNMADHKTALVMFYAPWCGHCNSLKPHFAEAAKELKTYDPPVTLVKVDCTGDGKGTCNEYDVSGYPTLMIFRNGKMIKEYPGPRDTAGIVKYMTMQVGPSSKEFTEVLPLENYVNSGDVPSVVGFFQEDTDLKEAFLKAAEDMRDKIRFAHTSSQDILEKYELSDDILLYRTVHMRNKFEDDSVKFSGNATKDEIKQFIKNNYHGLVGHRTRTNKKDFKLPMVIAYYPIDYKRNLKVTNYWRNRVLKVAKQYKDVLTFVISSSDDLYQYGDFSFKDKPIVFVKDADDKKYKMDDDFSVESLENFVSNFLDKKLKQFLKSEPIPESNDENVKVVVAENFDEMVTNNEKDILIKFYSPNCGHCRRMAPIYDELAENMVNEDIAFLKMDATANDVPSPYTVGAYPTIYWVPKDSKDKPIEYNGGRQLNHFIQYVAEHATNPLKGFDRKGKKIEKEKTEL